jgi:hypothetical protein
VPIISLTTPLSIFLAQTTFGFALLLVNSFFHTMRLDSFHIGPSTDATKRRADQFAPIELLSIPSKQVALLLHRENQDGHL